MDTNEEQSTEKQKNNFSWHEFPFLFIKGFLMGSADIVPGVSGGTMALITGIYGRLINAIRSFDVSFIKRLFRLRLRIAFSGVTWKFLLSLILGMACSVLFFTKVVPLQVYMFTDPELVFGLFFGLIIGSVIVLTKKIEDFSWVHAIIIVIGMGIGFWIVTLVPSATPESPLFIFVSGSIAISAMILPGISGSYILLILRKYDLILSSIGQLGGAQTGEALLVLLPFGLGAVVGLALFSRLLSWLLERYEAKTLALLIGFLIGTLYVIWPYQDRTYKQIVTKEKVVNYQSPKVQQLLAASPDKKQPKYQQLGAIVPSDLNNGSKRVQLQTIKQKLIKSIPYIPYLTVEGSKTNHFSEGIWGMIVGLIMVVGLDYLRVKG